MSTTAELSDAKRRLPGVALEPVKLEWRENLGLRGLKSLPVRFETAVVPA